MPLTPSTTCFPSEARLRTPAGFGRVFRGGARVTDTCFCVYALPNSGGQARLGIAVARKAVASAVARNRVKRQVRESFRQHRAEIPALDVVVQAKRSAGMADCAGLRKSLEWHWQELKKRCAVS